MSTLSDLHVLDLKWVKKPAISDILGDLSVFPTMRRLQRAFGTRFVRVSLVSALLKQSIKKDLFKCSFFLVVLFNEMEALSFLCNASYT